MPTQDVDEDSQKITNNVCCVNWSSQTLSDTDLLSVDDLGFTTHIVRWECNI